MVGLKMVDTIGSGIRKMYNYQRQRLFPLPDYNLADNRVEVTITGKILDMNYANILAGNTDLNLLDIELLNRVQLGKPLSDEEIARLRSKHLIEGRKPKVYIAKHIAQKVGQKIEYSEHKGLGNKSCEEFLMTALRDHKSLSRKEIDKLLWRLLPDLLDDKQKKDKITNLLTKLRKRGQIKNKSQGPNLVIQNTLTSAGLEPLSFFSFLPVGIVCVIVGTLVLMPLSKWFLSKKGQKDDNKRSGKSLKQLVNEYGLSSNLFRLQVIKDSRLLGKTIIDLDIRRKYGLNIMEVRRGDASQHRFLKTITQKFAAPDTMLQAEDILYVTGEFDKVQLFAEDFLLEILGDHATEETQSATNSLDFYDIGIAEIVLMPASNLINQTIKEAGFRDKFNVNVLGIRRKKEYLLQDLGNERIHSGDVLLVQGTWNNIARLSKEDSDWVVLGQPLAEAAKVTLDYKAPVAAAIMVLMVAMMVFDFIPVAPVTAVMIAGILMVLTGCFRNVEAAYKTINWESIVLIAAMLPMSLALEKTGASEYISNTLVTGLGSYGPVALLAGIYLTTSLMTMFISNTATAVLLAPIALQSAIQIGVSPVPFLFAVTVGASMCFASPFSTPPNALVMPAGQYTFMDYVKVGLPLQIIMGIVMIFVLPLIFPF